MTKRVTDVIGKPVVSALTGKRMGMVTDLLLDDTGTSLVGVVVRQGWMKSESVLPIASLQTIGLDAIVSRSGEAVSAQEWRKRQVASGANVESERDRSRSYPQP